MPDSLHGYPSWEVNKRVLDKTEVSWNAGHKTDWECVELLRRIPCFGEIRVIAEEVAFDFSEVMLVSRKLGIDGEFAKFLRKNFTLSWKLRHQIWWKIWNKGLVTWDLYVKMEVMDREPVTDILGNFTPCMYARLWRSQDGVQMTSDLWESIQMNLHIYIGTVSNNVKLRWWLNSTMLLFTLSILHHHTHHTRRRLVQSLGNYSFNQRLIKGTINEAFSEGNRMFLNEEYRESIDKNGLNTWQQFKYVFVNIIHM